MPQTFDRLSVEQLDIRGRPVLPGQPGGVPAIPMTQAVPPYAGETARPYHLFSGGLALSNAALARDIIRAFPFVLVDAYRIGSIGIESAVGVAGAVARCGIYTADPLSFYPATLLTGGGDELDMSTTGLKTSGAGSVTMPCGVILWAAVVFGGSADANTRNFNFGSNPSQLTNAMGVRSGTPATVGHGVSVAFAYAALPATFPSGATGRVQTSLPVVFGQTA